MNLIPTGEKRESRKEDRQPRPLYFHSCFRTRRPFFRSESRASNTLPDILLGGKKRYLDDAVVSLRYKITKLGLLRYLVYLLHHRTPLQRHCRGTTRSITNLLFRYGRLLFWWHRSESKPSLLHRTGSVGAILTSFQLPSPSTPSNVITIAPVSTTAETPDSG